MGQKIIPTSLRLFKRKNWHSQWFVDKKDYSDILHFDLDVRNYFETIFNRKNCKILSLKINKYSKNINIHLFIQKTKQNVSYNVKIKRIIKNLTKFLNNEYNIKIFVRSIKRQKYFFVKK